MEQHTDEFATPNAHQARAHREYSALTRITERHAAAPETRHRGEHPSIVAPYEAVRLVGDLASGSLVPEPNEEGADAADIVAALTLVPKMRADVDALEESLLLVARGHGLTWRDIAFGLGLGSAQAARQRYERISGRSAAAAN